ncbi:MAG: SnoaL-like domain-containing protein [Cyclobacteriaceae bacterium]|nr:SnoaL-like domain-containing protein [Cyclobacteriaceae bacterium]
MKSAGGEPGRHVIQLFFESIRALWEDITISVEHVVAEDNWVMGRSVATATHSKIVMGVPPTNRQIKVSFWDLHLFNDEGQIIQTWNQIDNAAIMKQIGLLS